MVATVPASTSSSTSGSDLLAWVDQLVAQGRNKGWTSFGQSNAEKGVPGAGIEQGQDFKLSPGTPIPGINGTVTSVTNWGYGDKAVTIKDALGNLFTVGHVTPAVIPGESVTNGQTIGYSRGFKSPISSGPHIEFRVMPKGSSTLVDPLKWLQGGTTTRTTGITAQAAAQSPATAQAAGNINIPINVGPYHGNVSFPNPFKQVIRLFYLLLGILIIIVGIWLMVEGSKR